MTKEKSATTMKRLAAGVRLVKSGRYEKRFTVDGVRYSVYGKTAKELAEKETAKRLQLKESGYTKNTAVTLAKYFDEWIEHKAASVAGNTVYSYRSRFDNHIRRPLGRFKVSAIERRQIIGLFSDIAGKKGTNMANACRALLVQIFQSACYDGIISTNIAETIPALKKADDAPPARETIHRALTTTEIARFMEAAANSHYFHAFRFMLATGTRAGECAGLKWNDVDYKNGVIHIRRTVTRDENGRPLLGSTTKTKKSRRDIPINAEIGEILAAQRAQNTALFGNQFDMGALIFPTRDNTVTCAVIMSNCIGQMIDAYNRRNKDGARLERFTVHAFRDTFASKAAAAGVPLNVLKELLGHSSYAMTADLYGHIYDEQKRDAMAGLRVNVG